MFLYKQRTPYVPVYYCFFVFFPQDINLLKKHYDTVDDIDLIVGLLLEKLSDGALVGPTARCLIADSFYRFKAGDRFFYDVRGQPGSFTPGKLFIHLVFDVTAPKTMWLAGPRLVANIIA